MRTWPEDHPKARLLERKQEAIQAAARELFLQHGYGGTTMEMVAARAGVSIMTLYRHFRSKEILFQEMIQHYCIHQRKKNVAEPFWEGSPYEVLCRLARARLTFYLSADEAALYRVIIGAVEHFPEVGQIYYQLRFEKVLGPLSDYLQKLDQQGIAQVPHPHHSAQSFLALQQGQIIERALLGLGPAPTTEEIEQHIDACVTLFLAAHQVHQQK